jgi:hypothetical protein
MLSSNLMQLDRAEVLRQATERAAGVDLGQLPVVPDQDQLGLGLGRVTGESVDRARADHSGFVDYQHRARRKAMSLIDVAKD